MALNYTLIALLEASKKKAADADEADTAAEDVDADAADTAEEDAADDAEDTGGEDEESTDDNEDSTEDEEENTDDEEEDSDENKEDEPSEDDFEMTPEEDPEDEPPPDGLVDPDDDGSGDDMEDDAEVNVQTNILQLSKLDRTLAKRKNYHDYLDLRSSVSSFRNVIDDNEAIVEPDIRDLVIEDLDKLYTQVTDYLRYKFTITNYEENLQNYMLFIKTLNSIVMRVTVDGKPNNRKKTSKKNKD